MIRCKHCGSHRFYFNAECQVIGHSANFTHYPYISYAPAYAKTKYAYCQNCDRKFASIADLEKAGVFDD